MRVSVSICEGVTRTSGGAALSGRGALARALWQLHHDVGEVSRELPSVDSLNNQNGLTDELCREQSPAANKQRCELTYVMEGFWAMRETVSRQ